MRLSTAHLISPYARLLNDQDEKSSRCPLEPGGGSFSYSHRPSSEGTFHIGAPRATPFMRWIEPKPSNS